MGLFDSTSTSSPQQYTGSSTGGSSPVFVGTKKSPTAIGGGNSAGKDLNTGIISGADLVQAGALKIGDKSSVTYNGINGADFASIIGKLGLDKTNANDNSGAFSGYVVTPSTSVSGESGGGNVPIAPPQTSNAIAGIWEKFNALPTVEKIAIGAVILAAGYYGYKKVFAK